MFIFVQSVLVFTCLIKMHNSMIKLHEEYIEWGQIVGKLADVVIPIAEERIAQMELDNKQMTNLLAARAYSETLREIRKENGKNNRGE